MVDIVGNLVQIVDLVLRIKDAVDAVHQNRMECDHIKCRVERVSHTLSPCKGNPELMKDSAVCTAVEALCKVLSEALEVVTSCQEETSGANAMCLCCTSGKLSKQLAMVDRGISDANLDVALAILVCLISKQTRIGALPAPLPRVPFFSRLARKMEGKLRTRKDSQPRSHHGGSSGGHSDGYDADGGDQSCTLLQQIAWVMLEINAAAETVQRNKEDCAEIRRRADKVGEHLSRLEGTEMMKDAAVRAVLEKLIETFCRGRTAVVACQSRSIVVFVPRHSAWLPGRLSGELRGVLDQMVLDIDALIDILPRVPPARD